MEKRLIMCRWFGDKIEEDPNCLDDVGFRDKAIRNICVHWDQEAPDEGLQRPMHSVKYTARVTVSKDGVIGRFLFENPDKEAVIVTELHYIDMLNKFGEHLEQVMVCIDMCNGSNKMKQLHIQTTSWWNGSSIDSRWG